MIEASATVIAVEGDDIVLEAEVESACGGCAVKQGCGTSVLAKTVGKKFSRLRTENTIQAAVGDRVVLGLPEQALVSGSVLVYLLPILAMILAAVAADSLLADSASHDGEVALAGLAGLVLGVWFSRRWLHGNAASAYQPVALRKQPPVIPIATDSPSRTC